MHLSKKSWIICIVTTIILTVVFGGIISVNFTKAEKVKESIKLGNKYLEEGNYEEAILAFQAIIKIEPKNIEARVNLAKVYVNLKDYDKAVEVLTKGYTATKNEDLKRRLEELQNKIPGNTPSNIANGGIIARQGDWIYYSNFDKGSNLFKVKVDGTNKIRLNNEYSDNINVLGNSIYYVESKATNNVMSYSDNGIYRMDINGSNRTKLLDTDAIKNFYIEQIKNDSNNRGKFNIDGHVQFINDSDAYIRSLNVVNGSLYFNVSFSNKSIRLPFGIIVKTNLNGTEEKIICKGGDTVKTAQGSAEDTNPSSCMVLGDWIYYINNQSNAYGTLLYRIKKDGTENSAINQSLPTSNKVFTQGLSGSENYVYYKNDYINNSDETHSGFYKVSDDLKEKVKFEGADISKTITTNAFGDYIYYSFENNLYRVKKDGSDKFKVCNFSEDQRISWINVVEGWVYFGGYSSSHGNGGRYMCRVKFDGTGLEYIN